MFNVYKGEIDKFTRPVRRQVEIQPRVQLADSYPNPADSQPIHSRYGYESVGIQPIPSRIGCESAEVSKKLSRSRSRRSADVGCRFKLSRCPSLVRTRISRICISRTRRMLTMHTRRCIRTNTIRSQFRPNPLMMMSDLRGDFEPRVFRRLMD